MKRPGRCSRGSAAGRSGGRGSFTGRRWGWGTRFGLARARSRIARRLQTGVLGGPFNRLTRRAYELMGRRPRVPLPAGCCLEERVDAADLAVAVGRLDETCDGGGFGVERSADYLVWRYVRHPERERTRWLGVRGKSGKLLGVAIVFLDDSAGGNVAVVQDVIAAAGRTDVVEAGVAARRCGWARPVGWGRWWLWLGREAYRPLYWELGFSVGARSALCVLIPKPVLEGLAGRHVELWHGAMF